MREFLAVTNALADESRLRLLMSLNGRELCVCKLVDIIGLSDSTVSKHMSLLKQAGLVETRKRGRWVYYRLADQESSPLVQQALDLARTHLAGSKIILSDVDRLAEILSRDDGLQCQQDTVPCASNQPVEAVGVV